MTFTQNLRPYPNEVAEIKEGTGVLPIDNAACLLLSIEPDAETILQLMTTAAVAAQGTNTLGIANPPVKLAMTSGIPSNSLIDLLDGSAAAMIGYYSPDAPRAYAIGGTVIIPNQAAPNGPPTATVVVDEYAGDLVNSWTPGKTRLVMTYPGGIGQFAWV